MATCKTLMLFGSTASKQNAKLELENLPQIKRIDITPNSQLKLFLTGSLKEAELISLMKRSGVYGFSMS